jgi:hypothetical protein
MRSGLPMSSFSSNGLANILFFFALIFGGMAMVAVIFGAFFGDLQSRPKSTILSLLLMFALLLAGWISLHIRLH